MVCYRVISVGIVRCLLFELFLLAASGFRIVWFFFFFQAEDGIRDLVRSRGLGDVYKRQHRVLAAQFVEEGSHVGRRRLGHDAAGLHRAGQEAVSYTHLTLPTSDLV